MIIKPNEKQFILARDFVNAALFCTIVFCYAGCPISVRTNFGMQWLHVIL